MNVSSLLKRTADTYPQKIALIEDEEKISYERLWQQIASLSNAFRSIGIRKNTRVAILLPNCKEFIYSFFALLNVNAIAVPVKPQMTCWELSGIFKNCTPEVVILTPTLLNKILDESPSLLANRTLIVREETREIPILDKEGHLEESLLHTLSDLYEMGRRDGDQRWKTHNTSSRQVASINYTYRGYGYPLGAMLTHTNYIHGSFNDIRHRKLSSTETHLLVLPCTHILPLEGSILAPLLVGAKVVIVDNYSSKKIFHAISSNKVNIVILVPTLFSALLRHYKSAQHDISSLKYGISGGSFMSVQLNRLIKEKMNLDVLQGYGLTECQPVTCNYLSNNKPETLGLPLHGVQMRIVDEKGRDCEIGKVGEILIKTSQNMAGYYRNKRDTMRVLKDGWLCTGDYGKVDQNGYVYFEGLKKHIVKVGGNAVDIAELRNLILSVKQVEDVTFDLHEDVVWGHKIAAKITRGRDHDSFTSNDLRRVLRRRISSYKIPHKLSM
ncbi:MAG: AMP-binding protein [Pseudomonadota bacterium]